MKHRFIVLILVSFLFQTNISYSQLFPRFSIAGGPTIGWQFQNTDAINTAMNELGIPSFPTDGFLTLGGGGFVDLPIKGLTWLRMGGSGTGFTYERQVTTTDNIQKTAYYSYGSGGVSFEYVNHLGKSVDFTGGLYLSTGTLDIKLYQNTAGYGNWNTIFGEIGSSLPSENISRNLSMRFYSAQPMVGIGVFLTSFMYAKLNAGYLFATNGDWYVDNDTPVTNVPSDISANGFNVNFGLNIGLFTK
ncbi:MAG TPA: hypothetical protein PKD83_10635 [Ignavibacteria bacterium]|nr:hypothetical protein [Ignavibacteria bacterium]